MSKLLQWVIGIGVVLVVAAVVFSTVAPLFGLRLGMMGGFYGGMGPGHMFDGGRFGGRMPMFGFGMPFFGFGMFLWPLLLLGLIVLGVYWLARGRVAPAAMPPAASPAPVAAPAPVSATVPCANCGRPLQPEWVACPYCGEKRNA